MPGPDLNRLRLTLRGTDAMGAPIGVGIDCVGLGRPVRSLGLYGDALDVIVVKSDWPDAGPSGWDLTKDLRVTFGEVTEPGAADVEVVTLGGYRLMLEDVVDFGVAQASGSITTVQTPTEQTIRLSLMTWPYVERERKGAVVRHKTFNPLRPDGLPDVTSADYKTNSELLMLVLDSLACTCTGLPGFLDSFNPPGAVDLGNAPAIDALEQLLARVGGAAALNNAGDDLSIVQLPRGGETLTLDSIITDHAEPYRLAERPSLRPAKIIVTSGQTKTTIVADRTLADFEWVWFDETAGKWKNDTETALTEDGLPGSIDNFRLLPKPGNATETKQWKRAFRALRLKNAADFKAARDLVSLPQNFTTVDGRQLSGAAVAVYGYAAVDIGKATLVNVPADRLGPAVRIDSVRAYPLAGVIEFTDADVVMVRLPEGGGPGSFAQANALADNDLAVVFCHQSNTGVFADDYFVAGWNITVSGGALVFTEMTEMERDAAMDDISVPKLAAPFLRRVATQAAFADPVVPINDAALKAAALSLAKARASAGLAKTGRIVVNGIRDIAPGASGGAVSRVEWDLTTLQTIVEINAHEAPTSFFDAIEAAAGRSFLGGLSGALTPRGSLSLSDVTRSLQPGGGA